jgi:hypothetical protein
MQDNQLPIKLSFYLVIWTLMLTLTSPLYAEVTASTDRTVLSIDETLRFEITSKNPSGKPDMSPIEQNFQILGSSQSQNYSLINGRSSQTHTWNFTLLPKQTGEVIIPSIQVGEEKTDPIQLVIKKQSATPELDGKDVFLKMELSDNQNRDFYVQQQIILKVQLYHRIRLINPSLSELELNNTVIEKLGNDSIYSKDLGDYRYKVIERHYAIFPQQSGPLTIPALTFTGHAEVSQNYSLFSRAGRQIISRSQPVTLNILPIPKEYTGKHWLPAESLVLESNIVENPQTIKAGEAITRHIVISASGLLGSQLPANTMRSNSQFKVYPDKEKLNNQLINGTVVGSRSDAIAIIPLKAGQFTLPEIKVDWWNTSSNKQQTTILPAKTLIALANSEMPTSQSQYNNKAQQTSPSKPRPAAKQSEPGSDSTELLNQPAPFNKNIWFWISLALLVLWLMTLALFFASRSKPRATPQTKPLPPPNNNEKYLQLLYDACHQNDAHKAAENLVQWASCYYKQPLLSGLSHVLNHINDEAVVKAINELEAVQYSADTHGWNGEPLSSAVEQMIQKDKVQKKAQQTQSVLSELNP